MYWDRVLCEVTNKNASTQEHKIASVAGLYDVDKKCRAETNNFRYLPKKNYCLGPKYNNTYFTRREAECMIMLLKGKTINKVAEALKLSPRTIEFYLKNMKAKIGCRTKFELVELVIESNFLQNVDFV